MTLPNQPPAAQAGTSGNGLSRAPAHHLARETGCKAGSPEVMTAELPNGLHQIQGINMTTDMEFMSALLFDAYMADAEAKALWERGQV